MKLSDVASIGYMIGISQFLAPWICLDLPNIRKITLVELKERDAFTREYVVHVDPSGRESTLRVHPESPGTKTILKLTDKYGGGWIVLDHNTQTVSSNGNHRWWGGHYGGSGDLGVILFGLPGLILSIPILIVNGFVWTIIQAITGMKRHQLSFYLRTRGQLDSFTRNLLKQALLKTCH